MSEEKEAIEKLKTFEFRRKTKNYNKISLEDSQSVGIVLNLIDKLQKENEEQFRQICKLSIKLDMETISKNKVVNMITQIDEEYSKTLEKDLSLELHNINAHRHDAMKTVLEELLEK